MSGLDPAALCAFVAAVAAVVALSSGQLNQWGVRRVAMAIAAISGAVAALILVPSLWWWSAILWGVHQGYLGWSFIARRRRTTSERFSYLQSSAAVLAYIALADGRVAAREAEVIASTYAGAGFSDDEVADVERVVRACERQFWNDGSDPARLFVLLRDACAVVVDHTNTTTRVAFFRAAVRVAIADGFVSADEDSALLAVATWLGLPAVQSSAAWRDAQEGNEASSASGPSPGAGHEGSESDPTGATIPPDLATYYASILGVSVTASPREMKRAYRERAKQYHPDVVTHRGPAFAREAEERFKELSRAYEFFRRGHDAT